MKKYLIPSIICFMSFVSLCVQIPYAHALGEQIKITEIMYDLEGSDTDREWVEIHNESADDVNLSGWKIFDGSNHLFNTPPTNGGQGSLVLPSGGFLIIAHDATVFLSEHPGYTGTVIDSVLSLANTGDTVRILDGSNQVMDEVVYLSSVGASGDGNTLSWYQSGWIATSPSPGSATQAPSSGGGNNTGGGGSSGGSTTTTTSLKPVTFLDSRKDPVWTVTLTPSVPTIFTHVPFRLSTKVLDPEKSEYQVGTFVYSLGDGRVVEMHSNTPLDIEYQESGAYVLYFEFYDARDKKTPVIKEQLLLSVEDAPIILSLSETPTYKISLSNLYTQMINISGWILSDGVHTFVFPQNTFLPGKRQMTLNTAIHTLTGKKLTLKTPTGYLVSEYPSGVTVSKIPPVLPDTHSAQVGEVSQDVFSQNSIVPQEILDSYTEPTYHEASQESALTASAVQTPLGALSLPVILFIILCVIVLCVIYLVRPQKNAAPLSVEDSSGLPYTAFAKEYTIEEIDMESPDIKK